MSGDSGTDAELISQLAGASMNHALGGTDPVALEATIAEVVEFALRALGHPHSDPTIERPHMASAIRPGAVPCEGTALGMCLG